MKYYTVGSYWKVRRSLKKVNPSAQIYQIYLGFCIAKTNTELQRGYDSIDTLLQIQEFKLQLK